MPADGLHFLTLDEAVIVEILAERIFPTTEDGPGASEAQVTNFIDRQLGGPWGSGARMYCSEPFLTPDHSGHGWQSPLTPAQVYRYGLAALGDYARQRYGESIDELEVTRVDELLAALAGDAVPTFTEVRAAAFFELLLENVREGLFADPSYGGNHGFIGWNWIGFPGDPDRYGEPYLRRFGDREPYVVQPRGLLPR